MTHKVLERFYLNGAVVYIDDTVSYGENEKYCLQNVRYECPSSMSPSAHFE